jgi:hypothetical protein
LSSAIEATITRQIRIFLRFGCMNLSMTELGLPMVLSSTLSLDMFAFFLSGNKFVP